MLNSDAPQPIKDRIYIPQEHSRKISHSEEAHDEGGGGFSFIFHQKGGKNPGENEGGEDEEQATATEIGDAVEVHISGKTAAENDGAEEAKTETPPAVDGGKNDSENKDDDGQEKKHINITV